MNRLFHPFSEILVSPRSFEIVGADGVILDTVSAVTREQAGDAFAFKRFGLYSFSFLRAAVPSIFAGASVREVAA